MPGTGNTAWCTEAMGGKLCCEYSHTTNITGCDITAWCTEAMGGKLCCKYSHTTNMPGCGITAWCTEAIGGKLCCHAGRDCYNSPHSRLEDMLPVMRLVNAVIELCQLAAAWQIECL